MVSCDRRLASILDEVKRVARKLRSIRVIDPARESVLDLDGSLQLAVHGTSRSVQNISASRLHARLNMPGRSSPRAGIWMLWPWSAPNMTRPTPVE